MAEANRRLFLQSFALGAGTFVSAKAFAAGNDGHAAGYDVAPASEFVRTVPRRAGDPTVFTASLDSGPAKATSGGWAREVNAHKLPIATGIAAAHLFVNAGGAREMHWHDSAEWAYVIGGHCQVTAIDPQGAVEVVNLAAGDLWYFPRGHSHAIQTLGDEPFHAILVFNDGLFSEHGTFGISDWMSRYDDSALSQALHLPAAFLDRLPKGETYIMQGAVLALNGPEARAAKPLPHAHSHRFGLTGHKPQVSNAGGTLHIVSAKEFPLSAAMTGTKLTLKPGALYEPHWHPDANEWQYVLKGRARATLFAPDKRMASAEIGPGDCAYFPRNAGHSIQNIGSEDVEIIGVLDSGAYSEATLTDWFAKAPPHLVANNFGIEQHDLAAFAKHKLVISARAE